MVWFDHWDASTLSWNIPSNVYFIQDTCLPLSRLIFFNNIFTLSPYHIIIFLKSIFLFILFVQMSTFVGKLLEKLVMETFLLQILWKDLVVGRMILSVCPLEVVRSLYTIHYLYLN